MMLGEIHHMASEYCLATDENRGGINQSLSSPHLTLINGWIHACCLWPGRAQGISSFQVLSCNGQGLLFWSWCFISLYLLDQQAPTKSFVKVVRKDSDYAYEPWSQYNPLGSNCFQHYPLNFTFYFHILHSIFKEPDMLFLLWFTMVTFHLKASALHIVG